MIPRDRALTLLTECTGETIWPIEYCRDRRLPEAWISELSDAFESSFDRDRDTIYFDKKPINQFHGIRDVDLAVKLAEFLGVNLIRIESTACSRSALVSAIKDAVEEG